MNEITKIHLGRQAFTISAEAHKALRDYLDAIEQQVGARGEEVLKEVELRMAELLDERGIASEKVILLEDITFLKQQLGEPADFRDEDDEATASSSTPSPKQLFRDTERGMLAGVAAGLAAYFGIDAVIVRLLFILAIVTGGWGILLYIILWLIVPEAKTQSDRLRMQGLAVTIDSLKQVVARADVPGVANRATGVIGRLVHSVGRVVLILIGTGFLAAALIGLLTTVASGSYILVHGAELAGEVLFPLGSQEVWLVISGIVAAVSVALMLSVAGIALIKRKWQMPAWATAAALGVFFIAVSTAVALGINITPSVQARYEKLRQTQTITVADFKSVELSGYNTQFVYKSSTDYGVEAHYFGKKRELPIKTDVKDGKLHIDATEAIENDNCDFLCIDADERLEIIIHAPKLEAVTLNDMANFMNESAINQDTMLVDLSPGAQFSLHLSNPKTLRIDLQPDGGARMVFGGLHGLSAATSYYTDIIATGSAINVDRVDELHVAAAADACERYAPRVFVGKTPMLTINGETLATVQSTMPSQQEGIAAQFDRKRLESGDRSAYNCVQFQQY